MLARTSRIARRIGLGFTLAILALPPALGEPAPNVERDALLGRLEALRFEASQYSLLRGADARRQIIVTGTSPSGETLDVTSRVELRADPPTAVEIDAGGLVVPRVDGSVKLTAVLERKDGSRVEAETALEIRGVGAEQPVNFPEQVVPIFTKHGCNGGGCHGKSGGQNGFRLSLLGFYPNEDYEFLVKESRGRRVFPAAPDQSLLLLKATGAVPHGGGARFDSESYEYRMLHRWMRQGLPYGSTEDPRVTKIEVHPSERTMLRDSDQQLAVFAHYSDGSIEDVTPMAQFESNNAEMAEVSPSGRVKTLDLPGNAAVMIRFQGHVGVFRASVPLGAEVGELPQPVNLVDEHIFAKLETLGIPPSGPSDDATFVRRATVDIAGRLPTAEEARAFAADQRPDRRARWIDHLLASNDYADHFAGKWAAILRNRKTNGKHTRATYAFHDWIRASLHQNLPYDEFVRAIVAASGDVSQHPPVTWYRAVSSREQQAEDAAQLFLGLRIQCARCHHHPFEKWSQGDYYGFLAFFSRVGKKQGENGIEAAQEPFIFHQRGRAGAKNPRSGAMMKPTGLGGDPLDLSPDHDPRLALADWMAQPDNPFFAKALVNRYWKHFFGRGLVEPEDDLRATNPATHPKLLSALASSFIASGYDLKELVRTITRSRAYQLSALPNEHNGTDKQNFSRYYPKRLTAETLYDSLYQVAGVTPTFGGLPKGTRAIQLPDSGIENYFLKVFGKPKGESSCECERSQDASLAQSLHLLNSKEVHGLLTAKDGRIAKLAAEKERSDAERIRELYHWVYARPPVDEELEIAVGHITASENKTAAYEDILWALINTKEFLFNH